MLERASARLWASIFAAVAILPVAATIVLAVWVIRIQIARPMLAEPSPVSLAATPAISPEQKKSETASSQRVAVTDPVALPPQARTSEPPSTTPTPGNPVQAETDRAEDTLPSASAMAAAKPAALESSKPTVGAASPMPAQVEAPAPAPPATAVDPVVLAPDAKAPERPPGLSLSATLAAVPPGQDEAPADSDPPSASPMMAAKPAAPEPSEQNAEPASQIPSQVEAPAPLPPATVAERIAPGPDAKASRFASALSVFATFAVAPPRLNGASAYADPTQDTSASPTPIMAAKPTAYEPSVPNAGAGSPIPSQAAAGPATVAERLAPAPDANAPGLASALSLFATFVVAPPRLSGASAYADPAQDALPSAPPRMAAKPAALELSGPASGPVPLPKSKPNVTVAHVSRSVPLPRPRPVGSEPRP